MLKAAPAPKLSIYGSIFYTGLRRCSQASATNKDHTQIQPLLRVDGLTQRQDVSSSANWKSLGGGVNLFRLLGFDHTADPEDTRGIREQEDNAGGDGYVGLFLLLAPQL